MSAVVEQPFPHSLEAEKGVLSAFLLSPSEVGEICNAEGVNAEQFYLPAHATLFRTMATLQRHQQPVDFITIAAAMGSRFEEFGGAPALNELTSYLPSAFEVRAYIKPLKENFQRRELIAMAEETLRSAQEGAAPVETVLAAMRERTEQIEAVKTGSSKGQLFAELDACRFDFHKQPPPPDPILEMAGVILATAENPVVIQGPPKAAKSSVVAACMAALLHPGAEHLGIVSRTERPGAILHFDTEQGHWHHDRLVRQALRRAGLAQSPPSLRSYRLKGFTLEKRVRMFFEEMDRAASVCGGIVATFVDGGADLLADVNSIAEANWLVDRFEQAAREFETTIVVIIHENPGSEIGKTRGHFGSQMERKAESSICVSREGEIFTVHTKHGRNGEVPKSKGPRFAWSEEHSMHMPVAAQASAAADAKRARRIETLEDCFHDADPGGMRRCDFMAKIMELDKCAAGTARDRFDEMKAMGLIAKTLTGNWRATL